VHSRSCGVVLADVLGSVVVLGLLSLSLDDWLDLLNDMSIDMFMDLGGVHRSRVGLLSARKGVLSLSLGVVLLGVLVADVLTTLSVNSRCVVLMVSVLLLLINNRLDLLVDVYFILLSVYNWGDLVMGVL